VCLYTQQARVDCSSSSRARLGSVRFVPDSWLSSHGWPACGCSSSRGGGSCSRSVLKHLLGMRIGRVLPLLMFSLSLSLSLSVSLSVITRCCCQMDRLLCVVPSLRPSKALQIPQVSGKSVVCAHCGPREFACHPPMLIVRCAASAPVCISDRRCQRPLDRHPAGT
jgi:hypothetical protein